MNPISLITVSLLIFVTLAQGWDLTYTCATATFIKAEEYRSSLLVSSLIPTSLPVTLPALSSSFSGYFNATSSSAGLGAAVTTTSSGSKSSSSSSLKTSSSSSSSKTSSSSSSSKKSSSSSSSKTSSSSSSSKKSSSSSSSKKSSSSTSSTSSSTSALSTFASLVLSEHNKKRALHGSPALKWSSELAAFAQDYVTNGYDPCSGSLEHSAVYYGKATGYGENLALGYTYTGAVDAWYSEIKNYDYSDPTDTSKGETGHFTQVVWNSTTELGCATKYCNAVWTNYIVCEYYPPGNVQGEYSEHVPPLLST